MEFGLSFLPDARPEDLSAAVYFANALELAQIADREGLASIKMTEHYLHPYGGFCPAPLGFLAAVAGCTKRVRLITGGVLPSFHHPVQLASEAAMVDAISHGRLEVGFARAYLPYEFAALGVPIDESRSRFVATVEAIVRLWTERAVTLETPFFAFREVTVLPRPTQHPHPPVSIAASLSPESFEWIGRKGFGLLATNLLSDRAYVKELVEIYREAFRATQGSSQRSRLTLSVPLYICDSPERSIDEADYYLSRYLDVWADAAEAWVGRESPAYVGYNHMAHVIRGSTPERLRRGGAVVVGEPAEVAEHVERFRDELGVDQILWQVDFGAMPLQASRKTLRSFVADVLPLLAPAEPSAGHSALAHA